MSESGVRRPEPWVDQTSPAPDDRSWDFPPDLTWPAGRLIAALSERGQTLATAESLTGGLIGAVITAISGASTIYRGGVVSYATDLKTQLAGVAASTLTADGAVSEQTAIEMARGVAGRCAADWGIAVTGVAGPRPQEGHPPGTVFCAIAWRPAASEPQTSAPMTHTVAEGAEDPANPPPNQTWTRQFRFMGERTTIQRATARAVLQLLAQICRR